MSGLDPRPWKRGDKITAARLNEQVNRLTALAGGAGLPADVRPGQKAGVTFQQFAVQEVKGDYLICHAITLDTNGELSEGTQDIKVAKPYLLRTSITERTTTAGLVHYTYQSDTERTATLGAQSETEKITPDYALGDVILAVRGIVGGTLVKVDDVPLQFMDITPRAWALV
ncbi:MAG: hypothetical protein M3495_07485 [Pseudomonadota bacterium]|nr:hypothetical protein [Gammaproteobacteria bacterium]MDQ3581454.1 hypothetical protein [Pseudomonadota bacterium]